MTNETLTNHLKEQGLDPAESGISYQVNPKSVLFVVSRPAKAALLLAPESDYTQSADKIGVSQESKIGQSDFDQRYVIRDPDGQAESVLSEEVISAVEALEPFVELEMSKKQYRLLKEGLDESQASETIKRLEKLVGLTTA